MKRKSREYEDDDGRTVADMSEVQRRNLFIPHKLDRQPASPQREDAEGESKPSRQPPLTGRETRSFIFGALSAGLLIALVFIVAIGLFIALLLLVWN